MEGYRAKDGDKIAYDAVKAIFLEYHFRPP